MALLEIREVTVRFGGNVAVDDVGLEVEAGRITGLIGPNGAGKTTLFNVITGLQSPTRGAVLLDGQDISGQAPYKRARSGMARTFQRLELFGSLTVRENIQMAASVHRRFARDSEPIADVATRIISQLGLTAVEEVRADSLPTGQGLIMKPR